MRHFALPKQTPWCRPWSHNPSFWLIKLSSNFKWLLKPMYSFSSFFYYSQKKKKKKIGMPQSILPQVDVHSSLYWLFTAEPQCAFYTDSREVWGCLLMSGVRMLHFLKDWWKFIQKHHTMHSMSLFMTECAIISFLYSSFCCLVGFVVVVLFFLSFLFSFKMLLLGPFTSTC